MKRSSLNDIDNSVIDNGPLVSIIVPVYNTAEGLLRRCLGSLLKQDYQNIELVIVDDGSDGNCVAVLDDILGHESCARVVQGPHMGVSHARNVGINAAKGEWVAFSDADDEIEPCFVSDALKVALVEDVDFVCGSVDWLYADSAPDRAAYNRDYYVADKQCDLTSAKMQMLGHMKYKSFMGPNYKGRGPVAKLYRKDLLTGLRYDTEISIGEDTLFNYQFIKRCGSLAIVDALWYLYYQYEGSTCHAVDTYPWIRSIDGILSNREEGESPVPFASRSALLAAQGAESIFRSGAAGGTARAVELLAYAGERGCFSEDCFDGFEIHVWMGAFVRLCRGRRYRAAYWLWGAKTIFADFFLKRKLIDPSSVPGLPGVGA